mmetsp:Transcript_1466/g.1966  ORF Transcript_1466/g.1966 Transcript_1466/m.1966 type:complete len:81 (-) Transcript_1466:632-874(-)
MTMFRSLLQALLAASCLLGSASAYAPSFVPGRGVSSMSKSVRALTNTAKTSSGRRNDIKMMPIGVPKVAYRVPGSQSADW